MDEAIENIDRYTYIVLTSKNGVDIFFNKMFSLGYDSRRLGGIKIGAIGPKTGKAIEKYGIKPDIIPNEYVAEALVEELKNVLNDKDRVLIPRAKSARPYLVEELSKLCKVDEVKIYDTLKEQCNPNELMEFLNDKEEIYFTFTSPSTFNNFVEILGDRSKDILSKGRIISIGPITSKTIKQNGYKVYSEAEKYTVDGIMDILLKEGEA